MSWSTREIAELADTSLRAVRHYHEIGLLPEPERRSNGYKQYGVEHLTRLLRIKRLTDLGFSLAQIAEVSEEEHPAEALRALDVHLAATIEQLQRARTELAVLLQHRAATELPTELVPMREVAQLSTADRQLIGVMSRFMSPQRLQAWKDLVRAEPQTDTDREFDALPADADEAAREDLAARLAPYVQRVRAEHPDALNPQDGSPIGPARMAEVAASAMREFYNPAQLDVLHRVSVLVGGQPA